MRRYTGSAGGDYTEPTRDVSESLAGQTEVTLSGTPTHIVGVNLGGGADLFQEVGDYTVQGDTLLLTTPLGAGI